MLFRSVITLVMLAIAGTGAQAAPNPANDAASVLTARYAARCVYGAKSSPEAMLSPLSDKTRQWALRHDVVICPHPELTEASPVVWYGSRMVLLWNPRIEGTLYQVGVVMEDLAKDEDVMREIISYKINGDIGYFPGGVPVVWQAVRHIPNDPHDD